VKKIVILFLGVFISIPLFFGCDTQPVAQGANDYNGRVFYEVFVRAFNDSNGDGIGDISGVTEKLDYMKEMGIEGIWLMPINKSPSYHGYDVIDYYAINEDYGTLEDFKKLLDEAHKRGIMVIMDMVINHTSSNNSWFMEASSNENSKYRDWYLWTKDENKTMESSPMGGDNPWIKNAHREEYYYALFWKEMPDLNFHNNEVKDEMKKIAKYYLDMGVDGFRLDAAKWIYNDAGSNLKWWKEYDNYVKSVNPKAVLVGEVWDNIFAMSPYQNVLDSFFDFSAGEEIIKSVNESSFNGLASSLKDNYELLTEENKDFVPAPFLTNHDQNRVMSILDDEKKLKEAAAIYLTLPGTPYVYYGEEIGMTGEKPDERIREPFIWDSKDDSKNTKWIDSTNDKEKAGYNLQKDDKNSIYSFYKDIINVRKNNDVLKYGDIIPVENKESKVFIMSRKHEQETAFVIVNSIDSESNITLKEGNYKVLYSSVRKDKKIKIKDALNLKPQEILIIKK